MEITMNEWMAGYGSSCCANNNNNAIVWWPCTCTLLCDEWFGLCFSFMWYPSFFYSHSNVALSGRMIRSRAASLRLDVLEVLCLLGHRRGRCADPAFC